MNFTFLESLPGLTSFYDYCREAEQFALTHPDISITAARKGMEFMVKLLYGSAVNQQFGTMTTYDMLADPDFVSYVDDRTLLNAFHAIRKKGNVAVHQGGLGQEDALEVLEQLHFLAGETAVSLGLVQEYPAFDSKLIPSEPVNKPVVQEEGEPQIEQSIITLFSGRLHSVYRLSQLCPAEKKNGYGTQVENPSSSAKAKKGSIVTHRAFQQFAESIADRFGDENVSADYTQQLIKLDLDGVSIVLAFKVGCCRVGVRTSRGEWQYLPGVDMVAYTDALDDEVPILEQLRVFTPEEFIGLWQELNHIQPKVSSGYRKKLKQVLGPDAVITIDEYADELKVQTLDTMHRKKKERLAQVLDSMPRLSGEGMEKLLALKKK